MPTNTVGSFAADGVFGFGRNAFDKALFPEPTQPVASKNAWSVLEPEEPTKPSPPKTNDEPLFGNPLPFSPQPASRDTFKDPMGFGMLPKVDIPAPQVPPFRFVPPQWVYEDPSGRVQGPFTSEQMHQWYKEGYFPPALPIKCVGDAQFISLVLFVEKYGSNQPFLDSLRDQEALERDFYYQSVARQQIPFRHPMGMDQRMQLFPDNPIGGGMPPFNSMDAGIRPFGNPMRFNNPVVQPTQQRTDQQGLLHFMAQHQYEEPMQQPQQVPAESVRSASPPPRQPSPTAENRGRAASRSPAFQPLSPQSPAKQEVYEPSPEQSPVPVPEVKPAKSKKKKEVASQQPLEETFQEKPAVIESKPAPWANMKKNESALKLIQEAEQKEAENRKRLEEKAARERVLAEAQAIAQREAAGSASGLPATSQWATGASSSKGKTLVEIMEDEEKERKLLENQNPIAQKAYANTVAGNTGPVKPINFAKVAAKTAPAPSPKEDDGWNVVKKPQKTTTPVAVAPSQPKLNYANSPSSPALNAEGQSPSQLQKPKVSSQTLQWCRTSLRSVARDSSLNSIWT
jgi:hypothetical protein